MAELTKITRPALRYHGGKFLLADFIISHFPDHEIYTEPFGGAASVLLKKKRCYAEVYNDIDNEVVNLFKVVRDSGPELVSKLSCTPFSRNEYLASYKKTKNEIERARRTIIRSFMGFGSGIQFKSTGFRSNSNRSGSTPAHDWVNLPLAYEAIIKRFKGVVIENKDWTEIVKQHDSEKTLHFFDPPYVLDTRYKGQKTNVYKYEMSNKDHVLFCDVILGLKGMSIICGYDNPIYNEILKDFRKVYRKAFADGAKERIEVLWISPNVPLKQISLFPTQSSLSNEN